LTLESHEAGLHGFWREYKNTFSQIENIGLDVDQVLSPYSPSTLFSRNGKVATAPVIVDEGESNTAPQLRDLSEQSLRKYVAANLPPPLDLPLLTQLGDSASNGKGDGRLDPIDLASGVGLLGAWADFEQESAASWANYDSQPASLLFEKAGVSDRLFEEMVSPLLHVLPMCPAYDCSAAAALSCFHVFALQSRGAFDVRWCRGSISSLIFGPWQMQLADRGVAFRGGTKVSSIEKKDTNFTINLDDSSESIECDAIVLAVGAVAAGRLASSSPALSSLQTTTNFDKLRGVTCVAVRLFLVPSSTSFNLQGGAYDRTQLPADMAKAMFDSPVCVCGAGIGGIDELKETGFCIYDLQRMHDEFKVKNEIGEDQMAVLEVDFYRADSMVDMTDEQIINLTLSAVSATLGTARMGSDQICDSVVIRARNAVSHFAPKSAMNSPQVKLGEGIYMCGDFIDRAGHASWSTEKSVVTAKQASGALSRDFDLGNSQCSVIPAASDSPQLSALRQSARLLRTIIPPKNIPPSPWVFARQLLTGNSQP